MPCWNIPGKSASVEIEIDTADDAHHKDISTISHVLKFYRLPKLDTKTHA
jgi:hypothetical protein